MAKKQKTTTIEVPGWKPADTGREIRPDSDGYRYVPGFGGLDKTFVGSASEAADYMAALAAARDEALRLEGAVASIYGK